MRRRSGLRSAMDNLPFQARVQQPDPVRRCLLLSKYVLLLSLCTAIAV
jgi:hypothetical protein